MAFNIQSWGRISSSANNDVVTLQDGTFVGAPNLYSYVSATDTEGTITAANYFNAVAADLNVGDLIYVVGSDSTGFATVATVTVQPPAVTLNAGAGDGDVVGPGSSTNNAVVRFSGTTGKIVKNSGVTIDDTNLLTAATLNATSLTVSRALVTDTSKNLVSSTTTATEIGYVNGVTSAIQTQFTNKISVTSAQIYAVDTGAVDAYVVVLSPAPTGYTQGMVVNFKATSTNTIEPTINVNGLGPKSIKKNASESLAATDILNGQLVTLIYDGVSFQLTSPGQFTNKISITSAEIYAADSGAANAYVVTLSPAPVAYTAGMVVNFKAANANTTTSTINVNGLGLQTIYKDVSTALGANDILTGQMVQLIHDGTNFQMSSPVGHVPGGVTPVTEGGTGVATLTTAYGVLTAGTTATGAVQTITPGATGTLLKSGGASGVPTFTTSTYPDTNAANSLLYASSANVMAALATVADRMLVTNGSGVPGWSLALPSGVSMTNATLTTPVTIGTPSAGSLTNCTNMRSLRSMQIFSSGSGTYTTPADVTNIAVGVLGAGGGGGGGLGGVGVVSAGGGGGGGSYAYKLFAPAAATYSYAVGSGGAGATAGSGSAGSNGGNSTFSTLTGGGGSGGSTGNAIAPGTTTQGGAATNATGGTFNMSGNAGGLGIGLTATCGIGGAGGAGVFGGGGGQLVNNSARTDGSNAQSSGGGGAGGASSGSAAAAAGGNGSNGIIIVWEFV